MTNNIFSEDEFIEDSQKNKYLTFNISEETYGIEITYVTEIVGLQPITEVPELPSFIIGIINLRGEIFPVMDARMRFKKEKISYNDRTCIIVIQIQKLSIGIVVDRVSEVMDIEEAHIVPPPTFGNSNRRFIKRIGKIDQSVVLILDCDQLIDETEIRQLEVQQ